MLQQDRHAFWRRHIEAFEEHGRSQDEYCREHGLSARQLRKWRTRLVGPVRLPPRAMPKDRRGPEPELSEIAYPALVLDRDPPTSTAEPVGQIVRRRRWSDDEKRQLVWDGLNSGQSLSQYAKRLRIHPSVMHRWLCTLTRPALSEPPSSEPAFAEVRVAAAPRALPASATRSPAILGASAIEIVLADGRLVRVGPDFDPDALRRVIAVLEGTA